MGLLELLFPKRKELIEAKTTFKMLNGYTPVFHSWNGRIYESQFVRSAIDARARHIMKLAIRVTGGTKSELLTSLKKAPNSFMTWSQFLYRVSTILDVQNNAFILPIRDKYGSVTGIYPICPREWTLVQANTGEVWIRFTFDSGKTAERLADVGILTKYQYESDYFGATNRCLDETMQLITIQRQGIEEYTKNASTYRFMAKLSNFAKAEDLALERQRFDAENFHKNNGGGLLLFPNTYNDIKQITSQSFVIDTEQLKLIERNVYDYFGVNEDVIQNKAFGDAFSAFYEGAVEPFAVQLSEVMTRMIFSEREIAFGSGIFFTANRIQYMTNGDKLNVSKDLVDRGVLSINEAREIWHLDPIEGGDVHILRGEYYDAQTGEKVDQIGDENEE